jgi:rhodanese-related sulfurtransferase
MKTLRFITICAILTATLAGCAVLGEQSETAPTDGVTAQAEYKKITPDEAKTLIDGGEYILLDVRTQEEYDEKHIAGAKLLPYDEISDKAETELPDKDAPILLYCRTGRRSKTAAETLIGLGYTNVLDFGGIVDWPYETE